jgi:hypothetical protein
MSNSSNTSNQQKTITTTKTQKLTATHLMEIARNKSWTKLQANAWKAPTEEKIITWKAKLQMMIETTKEIQKSADN